MSAMNSTRLFLWVSLRLYQFWYSFLLLALVFCWFENSLRRRWWFCYCSWSISANWCIWERPGMFNYRIHKFNHKFVKFWGSTFLLKLKSPSLRTMPNQSLLLLAFTFSSTFWNMRTFLLNTGNLQQKLKTSSLWRNKQGLQNLSLISYWLLSL